MSRDRYLSSWWLPRLLSQSGPELRIGEKGLAWSETSDTAKGTTIFARVKGVTLKRGMLRSTVRSVELRSLAPLLLAGSLWALSNYPMGA